MSIGFRFTTLVKKQDVTLAAVRRLAGEFHYPVFCGEGWARVEFCRMGEILLTFTEVKQGLFAKIQLSCEVNTSAVGAGFHAAAIDFVDALASSEQMKMEMADETKYYEHRNFERMRREHFYSWLNNLVEFCRKSREEMNNLCLCWDMNQYLPENIPGTVITPFGRFNINDMVALVEREGIEAFAKGFFLWNERERDGRFYRNCALAMLWEDCFFQPGGRSEADNGVNQTVIELLEQAMLLDSGLSMPKAEYALLCRLQDHRPVDISSFPDYESSYPIGFRRSLVSNRMGNTSLTVHGSFLMEEDENATIWYDGQLDHWHSIRVSAMDVRQGSAEFSPRLFENTAEPMEEFDAGDGRGRAAFAGEQQNDAGETYYQSIAQIICQRQMTFITASYQYLEEKEWAMVLFRQIKAFFV